MLTRSNERRPVLGVVIVGLAMASPSLAETEFPLLVCEPAPSDFDGFPWESSAALFSTYRNQYLYPSTTLQELRDSGVVAITSIQAVAAVDSTNVYAESGPHTGHFSPNLIEQAAVAALEREEVRWQRW